MFLVCFSVCTFTIVLLLFVPSRAPRLYSHPMSVLVISMFFVQADSCMSVNAFLAACRVTVFGYNYRVMRYLDKLID